VISTLKGIKTKDKYQVSGQKLKVQQWYLNGSTIVQPGFINNNLVLLCLNVVLKIAPLRLCG